MQSRNIEQQINVPKDSSINAKQKKKAIAAMNGRLQNALAAALHKWRLISKLYKLNES